jgi:hypothetical protein
MERAHSIYEKALPPGHPDTMGMMNSLAIVYEAMGEAARAAGLRARIAGIESRGGTQGEE